MMDKKPNKIIFILLVTLTPLCTFGQILFEEVLEINNFEEVNLSSVAFADIDGDTDQDVLITGFYDNDQRISKLYTNDGDGNYTEVTGAAFEGVSDGSIHFVDVDGDTDQDVLITGRNNSIQRISKLYINDGNGNFMEATGTLFEEVGGSISFADIDGDNDQDVLIIGDNSFNQRISKLYTNDGNGNYTEVADTAFERFRNSSIAFADIDGDTDQDVLIIGVNSSFDPISKLYTNDGNGNYTEATGTPIEGVSSGSFAFADIDGDNDQDVLVTGENSSDQRISKLYTNDGNGNYTETIGAAFEGVSGGSIAFADVDGDSDQDVLITGSGSSNPQISKLYTNDGNGNFTDVTGAAFEGVAFPSIAFADVDGDNDQDVLITGDNNVGISKLYTNDGNGNFTEATGAAFEGVSNGSIAFTDIDGDSDQNVLITGFSFTGPISRLYTNDGGGDFTEVTGTPFEAVWASSIAFADVDGDTDQDVLITGLDSAFQRISKLYTNDGNGNFMEATGTPFEEVFGGSIAFADIDGDGDPDVLVTGNNSDNQRFSELYTNDGNGNFTEAIGTPFEGVFAGRIAFTDVDGDNDQDVLLTGQVTFNQFISKLYTNDGNGNFTEATGTAFEGVSQGSIAFADVDGDTDQDVLITGENSSGQLISKLYTNDGNGIFTEVIDTAFEGVDFGSIAFADVDGDNDPDVLITGENSSEQPISKLYLNTTTLSIEDSTFGRHFISLYPNPTTNGLFSIKTTGLSGVVDIELFNLFGQAVNTQSLEVTGNEINISAQNLIRGVYLVKLSQGKQSYTTKVILK